MKSVSLDTNVLLRWLLRDVEEQAKAATRLISSDKSFTISDMAINEVVFVLERVVKADRQTVADNVFRILNQENFNCNRTLFKPAASLYVQHSGLSFVDCCLAIQAEQANTLPLYTFDKPLATRLKQAQLLESLDKEI